MTTPTPPKTSVKVYTHRTVNDSYGVHSEMIETFLGKWVQLSDYDQLQAELTKNKNALEEQIKLYVKLNQQNETLLKCVEFYAAWKSWDWNSDRVGDSSLLTNIKNDDSLLSYVENDGDTYQNNFGGKRARAALAKIGIGNE